MIEAVLFDNDGVLVDTESLYFEAGRVTLAEVGIELTLDACLLPVRLGPLWQTFVFSLYPSAVMRQ